MPCCADRQRGLEVGPDQQSPDTAADIDIASDGAFELNSPRSCPARIASLRRSNFDVRSASNPFCETLAIPGARSLVGGLQCFAVTESVFASTMLFQRPAANAIHWINGFRRSLNLGRSQNPRSISVSGATWPRDG